MAFNRAEVPAARKWRVEDMFASTEAWETLFASVAERVDFSIYEGKLSDPDVLRICLDTLNEVSRDLGLLSVYAFIRNDEDTRKSEYMALLSRATMLEMQLGENTAFITPELTALPLETLQALSTDPRLTDYDYTIRCLIRHKPHVLSRETEAILAQGGKVFDGFHQIFGMMDNADFPAPTIKVEGERVQVTHGMYGVLLRHPDRRVRKAAFQAYYKTYIDRINSLTATYVGNVDKDVFLSRARKYDSCLDGALATEDVSRKVYENLLKSVTRGLPLLHRYYRDRKKLLGLSSQHMYDLYMSCVEDVDLKVDYETAFGMVKEGLAPLGEHYGKLLQEAHDNGWIDVEETEGKRNGAYSVSIHGMPHPYVLLNYQQTTGDIFTIAHELGHAMHSYFSQAAQPPEKSGYKIFVAEVASTVNEVLLVKDMLKKTDDPKLKKYLLSYYLDTLKGTLFRQTQFAEFEYIAHNMAERGEPLTKDSLCEIYFDLNKKYYGRSVVADPEIAYEWARIPHFYRAFYVYKYATGIVSAVSIAERILSEGQPAVDDYFRFLSSGGSDSPVELLKLAGVDLTRMNAFNTCMASFKAALEEFESIEA